MLLHSLAGHRLFLCRQVVSLISHGKSSDFWSEWRELRVERFLNTFLQFLRKDGALWWVTQFKLKDTATILRVYIHIWLLSTMSSKEERNVALSYTLWWLFTLSVSDRKSIYSTYGIKMSSNKLVASDVCSECTYSLCRDFFVQQTVCWLMFTVVGVELRH